MASALPRRNKARHFYVVDASAVFNGLLQDPRSVKLSGKPVLILTTGLLSELDNKIHRDPTLKPQYNNFMKLLRDAMALGKLSAGITPTKANYTLFYVKADLRQRKSFQSYLSWMDDCVDKQLLCLAMEMRDDGYATTILTADGLMQVIAHEEGVSYQFVGRNGVPELPRSNTAPSPQEPPTSSSRGSITIQDS